MGNNFHSMGKYLLLNEFFNYLIDNLTAKWLAYKAVCTNITRLFSVGSIIMCSNHNYFYFRVTMFDMLKKIKPQSVRQMIIQEYDKRRVPL